MLTEEQIKRRAAQQLQAKAIVEQNKYLKYKYLTDRVDKLFSEGIIVKEKKGFRVILRKE